MKILLRSLLLQLTFFAAVAVPTSHAGTMFYDDFSGPTLDPFWTTLTDIPGSTVVQSGGVLTVDSPVAPSGFRDSGVRSVNTYGSVDFTASVDFRMPRGIAHAWLSIGQASAADPNFYGLYLFRFSDYRSWLDNGSFVGNRYERPSFGDERTAWHNFEISYDADLQIATASIDNVVVATDSVDLSNSFIQLNMKDNRFFYGPGPSTVEYDNFQLREVPEPTSLAVFAIGAVGLAGSVVRRRRNRNQ